MSAFIVGSQFCHQDMTTMPPAASASGELITEDCHNSIIFTCHAGIDELRQEWSEFQARAWGGLYESLQWTSAWLDTAAEPGDQTRIVVGRKLDGSMVLLLPLAIRKRSGARVLGWLSEPIINCGIGLYDPKWLHSHHDDLGDLWVNIEACVGEFDAVHLKCLPAHWAGVPHPLGRLVTIRQANDVYVTRLSGDYEAFYAAKRSPQSRRGARKRDARLERSGTLTFELPQSDADYNSVLATLFAQRKARLGKAGVVPPLDDIEFAFLQNLHKRCANSETQLLVFALRLDGEILAITAGCSFHGTYYALTRSMTENDEQRYSPGDAALRRTIKACSDLGLDRFDFGPGFATDKAGWADEVIALHEALHVRRLRGLPYVIVAGARTAAKRKVKTSRWLWPKITKLRRLLSRLTGAR